MDGMDDHGDDYEDDFEADFASGQPLVVATSRLEYQILIRSGSIDPFDPHIGSQALGDGAFRIFSAGYPTERERESVQA